MMSQRRPAYGNSKFATPQNVHGIRHFSPPTARKLPTSCQPLTMARKADVDKRANFTGGLESQDGVSSEPARPPPFPVDD